MKTRMRIVVPALLVVLALALTLTAAFAALTEKPSTKTKGATTVTWDSSFVETEYTQGNEMTVYVDWQKVGMSGSASYNSFGAKKKTWTPPKDVQGSWSASGSNPVALTVKFNSLHYDAKRQCLIGNGHFKLYLNIDKDGLPGEEAEAGYGVNVHVEDSTNPDAAVCPPDTGTGKPPKKKK